MAFPTQTCNTISVRLDETNYPAWVFQMQHHLRGHGLLKFVDGSHPCPPQFLIGNDGSLTTDNTRAYEKWLEQDSFVISMIITTLCVYALTLVVGCQTSIEVWLILKERYVIVSDSHIMQLKVALHNIQKGSDSIDKYLLRFKYMRDRLAMAGVEMSDQDVKFLILAGLPIEYCHTRQIIRGKRDITMNEVRSLLLSAEFEIDLQNKALSLSSLTGMAAQNGISSGNSLTASTGFISSSQAPSVGFLGAPISSTPGGTNFQANFHDTRMMSSNGSEFQSTHQNTPLINICTTMSQAPYIMHNTPSAVGFVNLSYGASQPTIAQQQSGNNMPSASGFVAQYNNGNGDNNNRNTDSGNYSKPRFNSNQGPLICQICEKPGHSAYKCYHRNPQQQVDMQKQREECTSAIFEGQIANNDDEMLKVEAAVNAADSRRQHYGIQPPTCATPKALSASICTQPKPPSIATQPNTNSSQSQIVKPITITPTYPLSVPTHPHLQQALLKKIIALSTPDTWLRSSTQQKNLMNCRQYCQPMHLWQSLPLIPPG